MTKCCWRTVGPDQRQGIWRYAWAVLRLEIVAYDEAWPQAFAAERDRIAASLGPLALRIEHPGHARDGGEDLR